MLSSHLPFSLGKSISNYNTSSLICLVHWFKCALPLLECFFPEFCRRRGAGTPQTSPMPGLAPSTLTYCRLPPHPHPRPRAQPSPSRHIHLPLLTHAYLIILISLPVGGLRRTVIHEMPFCHPPPPSRPLRILHIFCISAQGCGSQRCTCHPNHIDISPHLSCSSLITPHSSFGHDNKRKAKV